VCYSIMEPHAATAHIELQEPASCVRPSELTGTSFEAYSQWLHQPQGDSAHHDAFTSPEDGAVAMQTHVLQGTPPPRSVTPEVGYPRGRSPSSATSVRGCMRPANGSRTREAFTREAARC